MYDQSSIWYKDPFNVDFNDKTKIEQYYHSMVFLAKSLSHMESSFLFLETGFIPFDFSAQCYKSRTI